MSNRAVHALSYEFNGETRQVEIGITSAFDYLEVLKMDQANRMNWFADILAEQEHLSCMPAHEFVAMYNAWGNFLQTGN